MAGPPSGCSTGGGSGQGFLGSLWSCIVGFTSKHEDTPVNTAQVQQNVTDFQIVNSSRVTVFMCEQADDRYGKLYRKEIFQPLDFELPGLPDDEGEENIEQPVNNDGPSGSVEPMTDGMDKVKDEVSEDC